jgi:acyl-ACP thioesterase
MIRAGAEPSRGIRDNTRMDLPEPDAAGTAGPRVFTVRRPVRGTDVNADGRLRLDALARYLQEAAEDDLADAGWRGTHVWLVRRCAVRVGRYPRLGQRLRVQTCCSATGPRWAERTTTLASDGGELVRATAVWAAVAPGTGRPCPLGEQFHRIYGPSAAGRTVSARLSHPRPPGPSSAGPARPWPLRATDFDASGHVNNTVHWAAAEDLLAGLGWLPSTADMEYHRPILPGHEPRILTRNAPQEIQAWLLNGGQALASVRLSR